MFDLSEVVNDPDLGVPVTIIRTSGSFGPGGWKQNTPVMIPSFGIVGIASQKALEQIPEGDRVTGSLEFVTATPIFATSDAQSQTSDQIDWDGDRYRVAGVFPWKHAGFYAAILVRIPGN